MALEYVRVDYPYPRRVLIDGVDGGATGEILRVDTGTHEFALDGVRNYAPTTIERNIHDTNPLAPAVIVFTTR